MLQKNYEQIDLLVNAWEKPTKYYKTIEGDYRVITIDEQGNEYRYTIIFDNNYNVIELRSI